MKATPAKKLIPLVPVKKEEGQTFLQSLWNGFVTAQLIGLGIAGIMAVSVPTFGATIRTRDMTRGKYLTSQSQNLSEYGMEKVDLSGHLQE